MIAEVIINNNAKELNRTFDYNVPIEFIEKIKVGSRVLVPFGNMKNLEEAFVINFKENTEYKTKNIAKIQEESLSKEKVELAKWMANRYFSNLSECIKLMLPPGTTTKNMQNRVKEKNINFVCLQKDIEQIYFDIETKKIKSEKHIRVLNFLIENGEMPIQDLELITETSRAVLKTIEKNGYIKIFEKQVNRNPLINKKIAKTSKLELTEEQQLAYEKIEEAIEDKFNSEFLIFGVTGSRKNRNIYAINRKSYKRR